MAGCIVLIFRDRFLQNRLCPQIKCAGGNRVYNSSSFFEKGRVGRDRKTAKLSLTSTGIVPASQEIMYFL